MKAAEIPAERLIWKSALVVAILLGYTGLFMKINLLERRVAAIEMRKQEASGLESRVEALERQQSRTTDQVIDLAGANSENSRAIISVVRSTRMGLRKLGLDIPER